MWSVTPYPVGTAAVPLGAGLPAGPFYAAVSAGSATTGGIYLGSTGVTVSSGLYIPAGAAPVPIPGFAGQGPQALYALTAAGTVTAVLMISSPR